MSASAVTLPDVHGQQRWIDRIVDVTGWRQEPGDGVGWEQVEAELGVALPTDFTELCRRFAPGLFYGYLDLLRPPGEGESWDLLSRWNVCRSEPVVAQKLGGEPWHRFDMSTTEFIYRVIDDPEFKPFTVADPPRRPFYLPRGQTISSAEEWDALTGAVGH